jgi:hypothetical protein
MSPQDPYPSYKNLDPYIDSERLKSLDSYLRERLERRLACERDLPFYTGPFLLDASAATLPGSRMVYLSRSERPEEYYNLDQPELWPLGEDAAEFAELMSFIETLPFKARGRMLIIYDPEGRAVTPHRDHDDVDLCHEFIWMRTNLDKPFYMQSAQSGKRAYVNSYSAWFDTVNQFHGGDATGRLAFSIRVDGVFTDEFRALIPFPEDNRASAATAWAMAQDALT